MDGSKPADVETVYETLRLLLICLIVGDLDYMYIDYRLYRLHVYRL